MSRFPSEAGGHPGGPARPGRRAPPGAGPRPGESWRPGGHHTAGFTDGPCPLDLGPGDSPGSGLLPRAFVVVRFALPVFRFRSGAVRCARPGPVRVGPTTGGSELRGWSLEQSPAHQPLTKILNQRINVDILDRLAALIKAIVAASSGGSPHPTPVGCLVASSPKSSAFVVR